MKRVINCEDCNTYLGEIRDATIKKNTKHYCWPCGEKEEPVQYTNDEFRGMDKSIADFFSKEYVK